jgi:hypothetical protein
MVLWIDGPRVGSAGVRREWPDGRHDLVGFTMTAADAVRLVARDRFRWRRVRFRPRHSVVEVGLDEVLSHRGLCARRDCPSPGQRGGVAGPLGGPGASWSPAGVRG